MERLSANPYAVKRLKPSDQPPFTVNDSIVSTLITDVTFELLLRTGNLFVVDHSYQANYPTIAGRYGAACNALFYINPFVRTQRPCSTPRGCLLSTSLLTTSSQSNEFLPLAIKTNVGSDLIYTPLDEPNDWLLAKIMFNLNDLFQAQMYHLAASHCVGEIVHEAALRTLSDSHPILALLNRCRLVVVFCGLYFFPERC
jgi:hypothetical protein